MSYIDDGRRWIKDRLSSDEYISGTPQDKIERVQDTLADLTQTERIRQMEALKSYATYYYVGHHNEYVPREIVQELSKVEHRIARLNLVDAARQRLQELGGPPTRQTLAEAVERSIREREEEKIAPRQSQAVLAEREEAIAERQSNRESNSPWMAQTGGASALSPNHLASARHSYENWEYKNTYGFADYVSFTQDKWQERERPKESQAIRQSVGVG